MRRYLQRGRILAVLAVLGAWAPARAENVYQYTDEDGVMVLTNVPRGGRSKRSAKVSDEGEVARLSNPAPAVYKPRLTSEEYEAYIAEACELYKIPPALARAVMAAESNFDPAAVSPKGAQGLMQLMPQTADEMFVSDAFDPKQNVFGGVRYLRVLANMFEGDMVRIIAAYNAGPDAVRKAGGIPSFAETQDYVRKVLRLYFAYKSE